MFIALEMPHRHVGLEEILLGHLRGRASRLLSSDEQCFTVGLGVYPCTHSLHDPIPIGDRSPLSQWWPQVVSFLLCLGRRDPQSREGQAQLSQSLSPQAQCGRMIPTGRRTRKFSSLLTYLEVVVL